METKSEQFDLVAMTRAPLAPASLHNPRCQDCRALVVMNAHSWSVDLHGSNPRKSTHVMKKGSFLFLLVSLFSILFLFYIVVFFILFYVILCYSYFHF